MFYDTSNWLAFVIYFVAGSVCGYVQSRNQESVRFVRDENGLLRNRLDFLRGLYQDVLDDRRQLRDQIIGRRDSFGKLYAVTRELDEVQPQKLYHTAIRIMQESLDSDSLAIFRVDNSGQFARLVAADQFLVGLQRGRAGRQPQHEGRRGVLLLVLDLGDDVIGGPLGYLLGGIFND